MERPLTDTEDFLHTKIPLTRAMGIRVEENGPDGIVVTAPLEVNHNHLGTAFGGSISAIATLAGYALLWLELGDRNAHIVIRRSSLSYDHPVRENLRAVCMRPSSEALEDFRAKFEKAGKARLQITVELVENGIACATYQGEYVAIR